MNVDMRRGDTLPPLVIDCGVDLTSATAVLVLGRRAGFPLFARQVTGTVDGAVTMGWETTDTDRVGVLNVQVETTWPDGTVQTFPAAGPVVVTVTADLNAPSGGDPTTGVGAGWWSIELAAAVATAVAAASTAEAATIRPDPLHPGLYLMGAP